MRSEPQGILDGVEGKCVLSGARAAEELNDCSEPEHQVVVRQGRHVGELHFAAFEIDRRDRRLVDGHVLVVLEEVAQRMSHRRRVEQAGGELVEHRLEAVVVVRVDQHDVDVRVLELAGGSETGKAPPRTTTRARPFADVPSAMSARLAAGRRGAA